jgi:protein-tyrosine-phosphatase
VLQCCPGPRATNHEPRTTAVPLFVCHANGCRSVLARYLYEHLCPGAFALSAGLEVGDEIKGRAREMLRAWGIDAYCVSCRV